MMFLPTFPWWRTEDPAAERPASIRRPSRIISIRHLRESRLSGVPEMSAHIANDRLPAEEIRDRL